MNKAQAMRKAVKALVLVRGYPFIGGHLLAEITPNILYPVVRTYGTFVIITDNTGKTLHISATVLRAYFNPVL